MEAFRAIRVVGEHVAPAAHALIDGEAAVSRLEGRSDQVFQVEVICTGNFKFGHALSVAGFDVAEHVLDAIVLRMVRDVRDRSDIEASEAVTDG